MNENAERVTDKELEAQAEDTPVQNEPQAEDDELDEQDEISNILSDDLNQLKGRFPELERISDVSELPNAIRYSALRDLGLTPTEAYLATSYGASADNRSHLRAAVPGASRSPKISMTRREWNIARALFEDISDSEIERLYKTVTR